MSKCPCGGGLIRHYDVWDKERRPRNQEYDWCGKCGFSWGVKE